MIVRPPDRKGERHHPGLPHTGMDARAATGGRTPEGRRRRLEQSLSPAYLEAPGHLSQVCRAPPPLPPPNMSRERFHGMVEKAVEYIRRRRFQIVPSQRFAVPSRGHVRAYRALRRLNPSPFLFFRLRRLRGDGPSPEVLVMRGGKVTIRSLPARASGATPKGRPRAELLADPKERAEHLMLDLGRTT